MAKFVKLKKHIGEPVPAKFTYVNNIGEEVEYTGNYTISNNSYMFSYIEHKRVNLIPHSTIVKENIKEYFTYLDNNGTERIFNKYDTLKFDGFTYSGIADFVEYEDEIIEIFEEK